MLSCADKLLVESSESCFLSVNHSEFEVFDVFYLHLQVLCDCFHQSLAVHSVGTWLLLKESVDDGCGDERPISLHSEGKLVTTHMNVEVGNPQDQVFVVPDSLLQLAIIHDDDLS